MSWLRFAIPNYRARVGHALSGMWPPAVRQTHSAVGRTYRFARCATSARGRPAIAALPCADVSAVRARVADASSPRTDGAVSALSAPAPRRVWVGVRPDTPVVWVGVRPDTPVVWVGVRPDTPVVWVGVRSDTPVVWVGVRSDTPVVWVGVRSD